MISLELFHFPPRDWAKRDVATAVRRLRLGLRHTCACTCERVGGCCVCVCVRVGWIQKEGKKKFVSPVDVQSAVSGCGLPFSEPPVSARRCNCNRNLQCRHTLAQHTHIQSFSVGLFCARFVKGYVAVASTRKGFKPGARHVCASLLSVSVPFTDRVYNNRAAL